jgi:TRAP-type C4-dicarboxylate transport system substrate-binding protein
MIYQKQGRAFAACSFLSCGRRIPFTRGGAFMKTRLWMTVCVIALISVALTVAPAMAAMKINVGSTFGPGAPVYKGQEKFKELVEQRSKGEFEVFVHPLGAMGGERDVFEAMSTGGLEMGARLGRHLDLFPQVPGLRGALCHEGH